MAQFNTNADFSTDAVNTIATIDAEDGNEGNITGYTTAELWSFGNTHVFEILAGGAQGPNYVQSRNTAGNRARVLGANGPGALAANTELDVLCQFRLPNALQDTDIVGFPLFDGSTSYGYGLRIYANGDMRLYYTRLTDPWSAVGALIAKGLASGTWYWWRHHITSDSRHSVKVWAGAHSAEPGAWDVGDGGAGGIVDTSVVTGATSLIGPGSIYTGTVVDFSWHSIGTAGDVAPGPVTGPSITNVDTDDAVFDGQTNVAINGADFGDGTGQSRVRVNNQADGLGATDVVQSLTGVTWTATAITLAALDLTGLSGSGFVFIRDAAGNENAAGHAITIEAAPGTLDFSAASLALKSNAVTNWANQTNVTAIVIRRSDNTIQYIATGLTTNAGGNLQNITNASIVGGTAYRVIPILSTGQEGLIRSITAS